MAIYHIDGGQLSACYGKNGEDQDSAYDIAGYQIFAKSVPYVPELTLVHSGLLSDIGTGITPQGLAVFGNYFFQFFTGDDTMRIFDRETYEMVGSYPAAELIHANTMQFGKPVQDTGFPLLYVSEWGISGGADSKTIDVLKVSLTGYTKVSSFTLPASCGNRPAFVGDWENGIGYTIGYEADTRDSDYMIISSFDLSDMATPTVQFTVPYMGVMNAWEYYNGSLIYYGNSWDNTELLISFIDTETHEVTQYSFPKTSNEEYEGCAVVGNTLFLSNWLGGGSTKYRFFTMNLPSPDYSGKRISFLGDSITTYAGYIPTGNAVYYTGENCGVTDVSQTWWKRLIDYAGMTLDLNNSWSGSRVTTTNGTESAGVTRASNLGTRPDIIIVYMGINDFNNEVTKTEFRTAYGQMLDTIGATYPRASVFCATLPTCERNGAAGDPEVNDAGVYLSEYNAIITEVAEAKGARILDFYNCGIVYGNLSEYAGDYETATGRALHPNAKGMQLIAEKAIRDIY